MIADDRRCRANTDNRSSSNVKIKTKISFTLGGERRTGNGGSTNRRPIEQRPPKRSSATNIVVAENLLLRFRTVFDSGVRMVATAYFRNYSYAF